MTRIVAVWAAWIAVVCLSLGVSAWLACRIAGVL